MALKSTSYYTPEIQPITALIYVFYLFSLVIIQHDDYANRAGGVGRQTLPPAMIWKPALVS